MNTQTDLELEGPAAQVLAPEAAQVPAPEPIRWSDIRDEIFSPAFLLKSAAGAAIGLIVLSLVSELFETRR